jgi:hypothetical protein
MLLCTPEYLETSDNERLPFKDPSLEEIFPGSAHGV